jgi:glutaredoxin-like protein
MGMIKEEDVKAIREVFGKELEGQVSIMLFYGSKDVCPYCTETIEIVETLASLDARIKVTKYDIKASQKEAKFVGVDKVPAIVIGGKKMYNVIYYGIPAGYEFSSLIEDIMDASKGTTRLKESTKEAARSITKPIDIKVFVTPTCPYCPKAVRMAHQLAMENLKIRGTMIEATEFMELSAKHGVMGVPKIIINDTLSFEGALPEDSFLTYVMAAAKKG